MSRQLPSDASLVLQIMEDVNEKLKMLNYEGQLLRKQPELKPLTRVYFALPGKASEQFPYFAHLVSFLFRLSGGESFEWSEFDDPTSIASSILDQLKKFSFPYDFPSSKFRHGSGDAVVLALDFLCDRAIAARRIKIAAPIYTSAASAGGADELASEMEENNDVEEEEKLNDEIADEADNFAEGADGEDFLKSPKSLGRQSVEWENSRPQEILNSKVDPNEWKLELERVEPQLKVKNTAAAKEWRTHLEAAAKHNAAMNEVFPQAKAALEKMAGNLKKSIEKIQSQERKINKEHEQVCQEFRLRKENQDGNERELAHLNEEVNALKMKFDATEDEIRKIKNSMNEKNNTMTDTQPLRKISSALATLKKEISGMELRIGVLSQAQTMWRLKQQAIKMQHANNQQRQSANGRGNEHAGRAN